MDDAIGAVTLIVAKEGAEAQLAELLARFANAFAGDDGTERYSVYRDGKDPRTFFLVEAFRDEAARKLHLRNPIIAETATEFRELLASAKVVIGSHVAGPALGIDAQ